MPTHPGTTETIGLGTISRETQRRLGEVKATWLEFSADPPRLRMRAAAPAQPFAPREVAGELLEFLGHLPEHQRNAAALEALRHLDPQTGQYLLRLLGQLENFEITARQRQAEVPSTKAPKD